jgi:DNA-binding transcriptional ArsR family regulator
MANDAFKALAHPLRRDVVERLSNEVATVGGVTRDSGVSKPTISRRPKMLEEAGVVSRVIDGRTHRLALRPEALAEASGWIEGQRERWERVFDVVEYLGGTEGATVTEASGHVVRIERTCADGQQSISTDARRDAQDGGWRGCFEELDRLLAG